TVAPAAWFMLLQATFPGQPIFSETSPFRLNPVPLPPTLPVDFDSSSLPSIHHSCAPLDLLAYHQLYLTTPRTNPSIWAVTWSSFISSPVLVRITIGTDWSSLNYKIEHWIVIPSTSELCELVQVAYPLCLIKTLSPQTLVLLWNIHL